MTAGYLPAVCIALAGTLIVGYLWELLEPWRPQPGRRDDGVLRDLERRKR